MESLLRDFNGSVELLSQESSRDTFPGSTLMRISHHRNVKSNKSSTLECVDCGICLHDVKALSVNAE